MQFFGNQTFVSIHLSNPLKSRYKSRQFIAKQQKFCIFAVMKQVIIDKGQRISAYLRGFEARSGAVPLVLIHGFCEDSSLWAGLMPAFSKVPVLSIDLPGFGASAPLKQPSMRAYAEAAFSVLEELGIRQMCNHRAFSAAMWRLNAGVVRESRVWVCFTPILFPTARSGASTAAGHRNAALRETRFVCGSVVSQPVQCRFCQGPARGSAGIDCEWKKAVARGHIPRFAGHDGAPRSQLTLEAAACPVLFILGTEDGLLPLEQAWKAAVKPATASVEVLSGVAHMGMFEAPEECGGGRWRGFMACVWVECVDEVGGELKHLAMIWIFEFFYYFLY